MLVRKNTKAYKTILQLITACQDRADRDKLVRLYITKAGDSLAHRISIEGIEGDAALFYEMTYQTVLNNLRSSDHQLQVNDEIPGVYYFHSSSNKVWDETPFEFDEAIRREFASLPELPIVRKKEASKKFVLPSPEPKPTAASPKKEKAPRPAKVAKTVDKGPKQPDFRVKHPIHFENLDKLIFRQAKVTKRDVLEYYDKLAEYLLPWLKDRPLSVRLQGEGSKVMELTVETLFKDEADDMPEWVKTTPGSTGKKESRLLFCGDKEHLLLYVERGCLEFIPSHARMKEVTSPDYIVIHVDSPDSGLEKAIAVALTGKDILEGLNLPSFIKTDAASGFHIYVPLDSKSDHETGQRVAEYICKLIRLKIPDVITLKGVTGYVYGKVSLDYTLNQEGKGIIAPYSLVSGQSPIVSTPLLWEEVAEGLRAEDFDHRSIFERLQQVDDPFGSIFKKKISAADLLQKMEEHYGFLL